MRRSFDRCHPTVTPGGGSCWRGMIGRRAILRFGLAVLLGLAVAASVDVLAGAPEAERASALPRAQPLIAAANEQPLTSGTRAELMQWGSRLGRCMASKGISLERPRSRRNEIILALSGHVPKDTRRLGLIVLACGDALGGPPANASLTFRPGESFYRLYKPKTCLLDTSPRETR
jgi:hypothetical protein